MNKEEKSPIGVKFPPGLIKQLDEEVETGDFRNRSELIIAAVRKYIEQRQEIRIKIQEQNNVKEQDCDFIASKDSFQDKSRTGILKKYFTGNNGDNMNGYDAIEDMKNTDFESIHQMIDFSQTLKIIGIILITVGIIYSIYKYCKEKEE